jgi:hypothetical protein
MPPITQQQASGMNIRDLSVNLANSQTPRRVSRPTSTPRVRRQTTGFNVQVPRTIPSTTLQSDQTVSDVFARRNEMEQEQAQGQQFDTDFNALMGRVQSPLTATPFKNPQQFIEQALLRRSTDTQNALDETRQGQATGFRGLARDVERTREQATDEFGLVDLQANLADTRNRIAERTNQLRTTMRDFETNAERRGVAREFVDSEKQAVQADAAAELADLSIIESAQAGNLQMAREDIDRAVNAKIQAFEFENQAIQTEIQRLEAMDTRESQARSEQLQVALGERTRLIEQAVADERQKLEYLSEAAANGADQGTLDAIRKASNVGEAAMMAGPFIGRLERMQAEASIRSSNALTAQRLTGGDTVSTPSGQQVAVPTFEEFINEKQNELGMSLTPQAREEYRAEYEAEVEVMNQANSLSRLSPTAAEIVRNPKSYFDLTATKKGEIIDELAKNGIDTKLIQEGKKRPLSATQADDLVQAQIARNGVIELKRKLDELEATGPIVGGVRRLNPYDPQVVAIMAEITRVVPGLARGIYKEVGVLTDSDVERYIATLANPSSTPEQREQLHRDTMAKVDQSINTVSDTYSALGYDLGKFDAEALTGAVDNLTDDEAYEEYLKLTNPRN